MRELRTRWWSGSGMGMGLGLGGVLLLLGCAQPAHKSTSPWPADAAFQTYPVIHCSSEEVPRALLLDVAERGRKERSISEETAREVYIAMRDQVLTTLNLFLATGRWAGNHAQLIPTREQPRGGTPPECRMFELALADEITLRLPSSVSGAPYIAPLAMVGYDYEPATQKGKSPRISVRIAALLARGDGHVLRTLNTVASTDYAQLVPYYQERSSQEVAQDLTEQIARNLARSISE